MQSYYRVFDSPIGPLTAIEQAGYVTHLKFGVVQTEGICQKTPLLQELQTQLDLYFAGQLRLFSIPIRPMGTLFQQKVWCALSEIPYGQTCSYQELAVQIGKPLACRAVGMANHRNPIPILIPCHRVIGKNTQLVGYAGGLAVKQFLLDLEKGP